MTNGLNLFNQPGLLGNVGMNVSGLLDPNQQAMMGAAQVLTQAGAPSRVPVSTGQALANAMAQGVSSYRQAQAAGMKQQMNKMKMQSQLLAMTQPTTEIKESNGRFVEITKQPLYVQTPDGKLKRNPQAGKVSIGEALNVGDPFSGGKTGLLNHIHRLAPKIQAGTATPAERQLYAIAANYLGNERLTTIPTPSGVQTIREPGFNPTEIGLPPARPDMAPTATDAQPTTGTNVLGGRLSEGAAKAWLQHDSIKGTWDQFVRDMQDIGPTINPFSADHKKIKGSYRAVFFALKDLAGLGVLSKSDEGLVERWLQDPTSFMAQWGKIDKKYMMADINNISAMIDRAQQSMESVYGAQPKETIKAGPKLPPGIPAGSRPTGRMFKGKEIWQGLDGLERVAD